MFQAACHWQLAIDLICQDNSLLSSSIEYKNGLREPNFRFGHGNSAIPDDLAKIIWEQHLEHNGSKINPDKSVITVIVKRATEIKAKIVDSQQ